MNAKPTPNTHAISDERNMRPEKNASRGEACQPWGRGCASGARGYPDPVRRDRARLVVIPAFNEEAALPATLAELGEIRPDLDVVVVSDGSVDKTAALARAAGVHVIELPFNLGIGGALQAGFRYAERAGYERAFQFDADGQHDPASWPTLEAGLEAGANLVIGSRFGDGIVEYKVGPLRRFAMRVLGWSVNRLVAPEVLRHVVGVPRLRRRDAALLRGRVPGGVHGLDRVAAARVLRRLPRERGARRGSASGARASRRPATCAWC